METLAIAGRKICCSLITVFYHSSLLYLTYDIYLHHTGLLLKVHIVSYKLSLNSVL